VLALGTRTAKVELVWREDYKDSKDGPTVTAGFRFVFKKENIDLKWSQIVALLVSGGHSNLTIGHKEYADLISHEIANPLTVVISLCDELEFLARSGSLNQESAETISRTIQDYVHKTKNIVKGMSAIFQSGQESSLTKESVSQLLDSTLSFYRNRFKKHGIELRESYFKKDLSIICLPEQMAQLMSNLFNNAETATRNQPDAWIEIKVQAHEQEIEISVSDSGRGIPIEIQRKIFNPYFSTKQNLHGVGLGLWICRKIIEGFGGQLHLDSQSNHTRFSIFLPRA